jgi:alpha-maltose-1-phosphate synthase
MISLGRTGTPAANRLAQAVISYRTENYDITGALVGRQSATEGFLRAYVQHGGADPVVCLSTAPAEIETFKDYVARHAPTGVRGEGLLPTEMMKIGETGTLYYPGPDLAHVAWLRRGLGQRSFSICGVNHTLSERVAMEAVGRLLISPVQEWDALVCTSTASKQVIVRILDEYAAYMRQLTGRKLKVRPRLPLIPLGVDCAAFTPAEGDAAARAQQRARLGIRDDEIVLLFFGRLDHALKANPLPMYIAAEQAATRTGERIRMLQVGHFPSEQVELSFRQAAAVVSPHVVHKFVDGRAIENRRAWFAADIFVSLSDNVQESFGLTPIEAMAAGLPVVVSDWNGYRETVRDGIDGFRIPTIMPPRGMGEALAFIYAAGYAPYDTTVGGAAQITAVHPSAAANALVKLIEDPDLRRRMGSAGRARARETFDWGVIVRGYQNLWAELAAIRSSAPEAAPPARGRAARPLAMDPFALFREFPTQHLKAATRIVLVPGVDVAKAQSIGRLAIAMPVRSILLDDDGVTNMIQRLERGPATVRELARLFPATRRQRAWYTVGWLCKTGLARWE